MTTGAKTIEDRLRSILGRLEAVEHTAQDQWMARCPYHDDSKSSLAVAKLGSTIGVHCHAGCPTESVMDKIGLTMADLFEPRDDRPNEPRGTIVKTYDYRDADGVLILQAVRFEPKDFRQRRPDGHGGWDWKVRGCKVVPYRLPEILASDPATLIYIVEGEKDSDRLWSLGISSTTNAGGASVRNPKNPHPPCKWKQAHGDHLVGRRVVVVPDNDPPGRDHADGVARTLYGVASSVKVLELPGLPAKGDVSDWLDAGGTAEQLLELAE